MVELDYKYSRIRAAKVARVRDGEARSCCDGLALQVFAKTKIFQVFAKKTTVSVFAMLCNDFHVKYKLCHIF